MAGQKEKKKDEQKTEQYIEQKDYDKKEALWEKYKFLHQGPAGLEDAKLDLDLYLYQAGSGE